MNGHDDGEEKRSLAKRKEPADFIRLTLEFTVSLKQYRKYSCIAV